MKCGEIAKSGTVGDRRQRFVGGARRRGAYRESRAEQQIGWRGVIVLPEQLEHAGGSKTHPAHDRPHIGHCYTTVLADVLARAGRLHNPAPAPEGGVFFLTGTDEHADKVVTSAADHQMTPIQWADRNAEEFKKAFAFMNTSHDDFIRTTQDRHISKVREYIRALQASGDIYLSDYVGCVDPSQEEYLT